MITIKPYHKGEPAPYLAYRERVQIRQGEWIIRWYTKDGIVEDYFHDSRGKYCLARMNAQTKKYKNPEFFHPWKRLKRNLTRLWNDLGV